MIERIGQAGAETKKKDATIIGNAPKIWQKESAAI
jgi:hypothetical protein